MTHHQPPDPNDLRQSLYDLIGGDAGVLKLVNSFYDIIETHPEAHKLHVLHLRGNGVAHARVAQFKFLSAFLGGPKLYFEEHGHANIRAIHEHVEIDEVAKDIWLNCMSLAIDDIGLEITTKRKLMLNFRVIAERLVNHNG